MKEQLEWQRKIIRDEYLDDDSLNIAPKSIFRKRRPQTKKLLSVAAPSNRSMNTSK
jgi:hypothetical protein